MSKKSQKTAASFKSIIPDEFRTADVYAVLKKELDKYGKFLKKDGERTTHFWKNPPAWVTRTTVVANGYKLELIVRGSSLQVKQWTYVDEGTRPHRIYPRRAKRLRFVWGGPGSYSAGSSPNYLTTSRPSVSGSVVYRKYVNHPGTAARNWSKVIRRDNERPLHAWMAAAMSHAARASGHSVTK